MKGYEGMKQRAASLGPDGHEQLSAALESLVELYEATGQQEQAAKWRTELEAAQAKAKQAKK